MPSDFPWQVILMGPENWTEWLNQLKIYAMGAGADQYLQNTATGADPFNDLRPPAKPDWRIADDLTMRRYTYEFDDYKKEADLVRDVNNFMMETVGQHYHVHFLDHRSPLSWIEALKAHLLPDSIDRDELALAFIQAVTADTQMMTNNTVKWIAEWEKLKIKVINTIYERRLPAFFMQAVRYQYPEFYNAWFPDVTRNRKDATIEALLTNFRTNRFGMRSHIALVDTSLSLPFALAQGAKQLTASGSNSRDNSYNTFQGNSDEGGKDNSKRKAGNPFEDCNCICGFYHPTSQCFLINPDKRPDGYVAQQWKLDKVNEDADRLCQRTRIEAEIGHPIPRQNIQKFTVAATANAATVIPTAPTVTGSRAMSDPVGNLPPDYRHMIPRPMSMSATESTLPGPMVDRDWTIFDSGTQRYIIMNAPESSVDFQPFQSRHCVLHGDSHTLISGPEGEHEIESGVQSVSSSNSISSRSLVVSSAPVELLHARLGHPGRAEIDIYHTPFLDSARDSATHDGQTVIIPPESLIPTPAPTPEHQCRHDEMGGDASEGLRDATQTVDIPFQQPPIITAPHIENLPLGQSVQKAGHDHDECPAKSQDTTLHACGINTDLRESNIIIEKREYNAQAMIIDTDNIPMVPFNFSFTVVWDPGGLPKMTGKCLWHRPDWG